MRTDRRDRLDRDAAEGEEALTKEQVDGSRVRRKRIRDDLEREGVSFAAIRALWHAEILHSPCAGGRRWGKRRRRSRSRIGLPRRAGAALWPTLGEADVLRFANRATLEFSVSIVSMAAAVMTVDRLLKAAPRRARRRARWRPRA